MSELPSNTIESNEQRDKREYLKIEDFEGLENMQILPYEGEGSTSFSKGYEEKMHYLNNLGIETTQYESDISMVGSLFIIATDIVIAEIYRRDAIKYFGSSESKEFRDYFGRVLDESNLKLEETRLDRFGYRGSLLSEPETRNEDLRSKLKFSNNPQKKISNAEIHELVRYAFSELKRNNS
jgi:hypothetical protein